MVPGSVPAFTGVIKLYGAGRLCAPLFAVLGHIERTTPTCRTSSIAHARDAGKGLFQHA